MPIVEVVPTSSKASAPGWAYVPDTGQDATKTLLQPTGARKRAARNAILQSGQGRDTTARQQAAIDKRIADLDKDNFREVHIPIPHRKDVVGKPRMKSVTGVRKILMSQKTFPNHLADEEAALALHPHNPLTAQSRPAATVAIQSTPVSKGSKPPTPSLGKKRKSLAQSNEDIEMADAPEQQHEASANTQSRSLDDENPLLKTYTPSAPSEALIQQLLSAPPLSYNKAAAQPSRLGIPKRHFCEICGYWGRIKCMKCGARTCSLNCYRSHEETRCLKFYA